MQKLDSSLSPSVRQSRSASGGKAFSEVSRADASVRHSPSLGAKPNAMTTTFSESPQRQHIAQRRSTPTPTLLDEANALRFGCVPIDVLDTIAASSSNSNADWKRRSAAVEALFSALKQASSAVIQSNVSEMDGLFDIVVRLLQDADVHLVKRALQITQLCFYKFSDCYGVEADDALETLRGGSAEAPLPDAALYLQKILPHLVESAADFADDPEVKAQLYSLFTQLFQSGFLSVARTTQTLLGAMHHRRLQVREEALKVWIVLLLVARRAGFSTSSVLRHNVLRTLGCLLGDSSVRVKEVAVEAGAVLATVTMCSNLTELVEEALDDFLVDRVDLDGFRRRLKQQQQLPTLLDDGQLSLSSTRKAPISSRSSHGLGLRSTASPVERSLSSVSELRMLASREFAPECLPQGVRQSRHGSSDVLRGSSSSGSSLHSPVHEPPTAASSMPDLNRHRHHERVVTSSTVDGSNRVSPAGRGSMSDRSYFLESSPSGNGVSALCDESTEAISAKLSMLKRKTAQLRKASSSKRVVDSDDDRGEMRTAEFLHDTSGQGAESYSTVIDARDRKSGATRSPERSDDWIGRQQKLETADAARSKRRLRGEDSSSPRNKSAPALSSNAQASPQKLQMIQSSSIEDRPIASKYALASKGQRLEDEITSSDEDATTASPSHVQRQQTQHKHSSVSSLRPDSASSKPPVQSTRAGKAQSRIGVTDSDDPTNDTPAPADDAYVPSGKAAAARPVSLATRKRLEAKAKQESGSDGSPSNDSALPSTVAAASFPATANDAKPRLQKKASLATVGKTGGNTLSDEAPRPSGGSSFGKQEPKYLEPHELKPLLNPKQDSSRLLEKISGSDWEATFDALSTVRRLAKHHPAFLEDKLHAVTKEILTQVTNLRSTVSKNSLLALDSLCSCFQKAMDPEVDGIIAVLIKRSTDSNAFVCESATSSVTSVILHCSPSKVVGALAVHLSSKAVPVRREVARAVHTLIVSMADQVQTSKDLSTIVGIVGRCLEDSNNEVRDAAKQSILYLSHEQRIDAERLKKLLPAGARSKFDQVLSANLRYKAPVTTHSTTSVSSEAPKAKTVDRDMPLASAASSASTSTSGARLPSSVTAIAGGPSTVPAATRRAPLSQTTGAVDSTTLEILQKKLESSNWKDRYDALQEATAFVCSGSTARALAESGKITGLFDALLKRMEDGNAKVNVFALENLAKMIPAFGDGLELVLSNLVPALARNLAASNPKLAALTVSVVQTLCDHVAAKLLCQHFAAIARHANSRVKPLLIDTLASLAATGDEKTQYALNRCVVCAPACTRARKGGEERRERCDGATAVHAARDARPRDALLCVQTELGAAAREGDVDLGDLDAIISAKRRHDGAIAPALVPLVSEKWR
ncbi:hypothetical protein PybrP1_007918 [[Pythium] brassicae (nom. inval.)]|nr:hypothetical protein PybrP1_007918 [[Pythium] brassicae (nom. inval.)]